ncbi:unnamed protein product [Victoria cruziana]
MSAELLHALTDDNPDLQKQIGCMTGIFQLFDRHHFISTRRLYSQQHKRLPSDHPHLNNGRVGAEEVAGSPRVSLEKNRIQSQHANIDSSVVSGSSSSCSSFSSLEFSRTAPSEPSSLDRPLRNAQKFHTSSTDNKQSISSFWSEQANFGSYSRSESLDFRDIVKDSMYRDSQKLSVKTRIKGEEVNHLTNPKVSPRPLQVPKLVDESPVKGISGKPKAPADLKESLRVLARLKEGPWCLSESRDSPRASYEAKDASWCSVSKEGSRFSYDGREIPRASCDSKDNYKSAKLKELPRLSLDERDCSSRSSSFDIKSGSILKDLQNNRIQKIGDNGQQPGIVAKLMGLEPIASSISSRNPVYEVETRLDRVLCSPKSSLTDPVSPRARKTDLVKKQTSDLQVSIETAPWRHSEGSIESPRKAVKSHLPAKKQTSDFVFNEIERRLKELKFQQSQKDIRALLDAVQAKVLLDNKKDQVGKTQQSQAPKTYPNQVSFVEPVNRQMPQRNSSISNPRRGSCSPKACESPIVIMRPVKPINKSNITSSSVINSSGFIYPQNNKLARDLKSLSQINGSKGSRPHLGLPSKFSTRETANRGQGSANRKVNSRTGDNQKPQARLTQILTKPQEVIRDSTTSSTKNSGPLSPRPQQKKHEERKTRQTNYLQSQVSSKLRKHSARQQSDVRYKDTKQISNLVCPIEDHASDKSSDAGRYMNHRSDETSTRSDSNISSASHCDEEIISVDLSSEMNSVFQKPSSVSNLEEKTQGASSSLSDERGFLELGCLGLEQPSPVSVLDHSFYKDDLPSPGKITHPFKDDGNQNMDDISGKEIWKPCNTSRLSNTRRSLNYSSIKGGHDKFSDVEHLVQKLQRLNSSHDEAATDYIASLCENSTPEHRYISEILLASGFLLKELTSEIVTNIEPCSYGFLINPDLFLVLEKTKASRLHKGEACNPGLPTQQKTDYERVQRRLIFDAVNEVLTDKLPVIDSGPWLGVPMLAKRVATGQRLLHEVCAEVDQLASKKYSNFDDMLFHLTCRLENWSDQRKDISTVVLEIEKMIFKDLIDEMVNRDGWRSFGKEANKGPPIKSLVSKLVLL